MTLLERMAAAHGGGSYRCHSGAQCTHLIAGPGYAEIGPAGEHATAESAEACNVRTYGPRPAWIDRLTAVDTTGRILGR
jgi:hypothetical protein